MARVRILDPSTHWPSSLQNPSPENPCPNSRKPIVASKVNLHKIVGTIFDFTHSNCPEELLGILRYNYSILKDIELRIPVEGESIDKPTVNCVSFYPQMFEYGVRLLLHHFAPLFLNAVKLAPVQLPPNGWGTLMGFWYLWWRFCSDGTCIFYVDQMLATHTIKKSSRALGGF